MRGVRVGATASAYASRFAVCLEIRVLTQPDSPKTRCPEDTTRRRLLPILAGGEKFALTWRRFEFRPSLYKWRRGDSGQLARPPSGVRRVRSGSPGAAPRPSYRPGGSWDLYALALLRQTLVPTRSMGTRREDPISLRRSIFPLKRPSPLKDQVRAALLQPLVTPRPPAG